MDQNAMNPQAKVALETHREAVKQWLEKSGASAADFKYDCTMWVTVAGAGNVTVDFAANGITVARFSGTPIVGLAAYKGWGTAVFFGPVQNLIGQQGTFTVELVGVIGGTGNAQFFINNGLVGMCFTGGVGLGAATSVGPGGFSAP